MVTFPNAEISMLTGQHQSRQGFFNVNLNTKCAVLTQSAQL